MPHRKNGGESGIRTHGRFNPTHDFESCALNRTQPSLRGGGKMRWRGGLVKPAIALTHLQLRPRSHEYHTYFEDANVRYSLTGSWDTVRSATSTHSGLRQYVP